MNGNVVQKIEAAERFELAAEYLKLFIGEIIKVGATSDSNMILNTALFFRFFL